MFKSLEIDEFGPWFARHFEGYGGLVGGEMGRNKFLFKLFE